MEQNRLLTTNNIECSQATPFQFTKKVTNTITQTLNQAWKVCLASPRERCRMDWVRRHAWLDAVLKVATQTCQEWVTVATDNKEEDRQGLVTLLSAAMDPLCLQIMVIREARRQTLVVRRGRNPIWLLLQWLLPWHCPFLYSDQWQWCWCWFLIDSSIIPYQHTTDD